MTIKEMNDNAKRKFLARVDHLIDDVPVSKEEARQVLADLGIDPKQALADTLAVVERFEEEQRKKRVHERFERAERERKAFQSKVLPRVEARAAELAKLPHAQLAAMWQSMQARHNVQVHHRKLESIPAYDLALLIARCELGDAGGEEK
jgi:hypothetical protein